MAIDSRTVSYSIIVPVFNEEAVLPMLLRRLDLLLTRLNGPAEVIIVDDGSSDSGTIVLEALVKRDPRYRLIGLSRNFGHQVAITAGMDAAQGQAIVVMDADLQDRLRSWSNSSPNGKKVTKSSMRGACRAPAKAGLSARRPICSTGYSGA